MKNKTGIKLDRLIAEYGKVNLIKCDDMGNIRKRVSTDKIGVALRYINKEGYTIKQ